MDAKERLQQLMDERGWTIYRLAKESNVAWTTIRNMFARNTDPSISTLESLCYGMDITLVQFFDTENNMGLSSEQLQLMHHWNRLTDKDKQLVLELITSLEQKKTGGERR